MTAPAVTSRGRVVAVVVAGLLVPALFAGAWFGWSQHQARAGDIAACEQWSVAARGYSKGYLDVADIRRAAHIVQNTAGTAELQTRGRMVVERMDEGNYDEFVIFAVALDQLCQAVTDY